MQRLFQNVPLLVAIAVLCTACRVERTPDEYFDAANSAEAERDASSGEVRDRLLAFVGAVGRGSATEAVIALNPAEGVDVVAPLGVGLNGPGAIRAVVAQLVTTPVAVRVREVEVTTGAVGGVAWFRMVLEAPGSTPEPNLYEATGTYLRDAGLWHLVQAHVSEVVTSDPTQSRSDSVSTAAEGE